jgi:hypothetical protein
MIRRNAPACTSPTEVLVTSASGTVRTLRRHTFEPVGAYTKKQWAEFGAVMHHLGITAEGGSGLIRYAQQIGRVELGLLWAQKQGLRVPAYVVESLKSAAKLAAADRSGASSRRS